MNKTRRDFLKTVGAATLGAGLLAGCGGFSPRPERFSVNRLGTGKLKLSWFPYELKLRHTFTVASYSRTTTPDVQVKIDSRRPCPHTSAKASKA